ncbi:MAG: thioredoxin domain-containing protein [Alphaproteobacteria bacterium]|nr:thioredoxin domain-containing protein [Alphaproteobacteria bacterium]
MNLKQQGISALVGGIAGAALALAVVAAGVFSSGQAVTDSRIRSYLMSHPDIVMAMINQAQLNQAQDEERQQQQAVDKVGAKRFFDPAVAYVTGPANAKNTFVEFFDYNCVHCRNSVATVKKFYEAHRSDTRFAFIDYPIFGEESTAAAQIAVAARQQGDRYVQLHFSLMGASGEVTGDVAFKSAQSLGFDMKKLMTDAGSTAAHQDITSVHRLGEEAALQGTPTFIINGKVHSGEITDEELAQLTKK